MTLQAGRVYGSMGRLGAARQGGATPWWLSGGIAAANCVAAYQPKGAASYAASKVNLANPGIYDAVEGVAPGWIAADGWIGDGAAFLSTGIVPERTWTLAARVDGNVDGNSGWIGCNYYGTGMFLYTGTVKRAYFTNRENYSVGSEFNYINASAVTTLAMSGPDCYVNGALSGSITNPTFDSNRIIGLMCIGLHTAYKLLGGFWVCGVIYNTTLSAAQVAALTAAMAAL